MTHQKLSLVVALILGTSCDQTTALPLGDVLVVGSGQLACRDWVQRKGSPTENQQQDEWLWGFVSAYNWYVAPEGNISKGMDGYGLASWIDTYCASHPLVGVVKAADTMINELQEKALIPPH